MSEKIFLKRSDFDTIIKAFYNEIAKQSVEFSGDKLDGLKLACKTFDQVTNAFKLNTKKDGQ